MFNANDCAEDTTLRNADGSWAFRNTRFYPAYPGYDWGILAGWAWGASRVADYLENDPAIDKTKLIVTGASRNGKSSHGGGGVRRATDGCAGGDWGRRHRGVPFRRAARRARRCDIMQKKYPNWFSPNLHEFWGQREKLPFDEHWFLALAAPRPFIALEGTRDQNVNANGVRQSFLVAMPAFQFLKVPDRLGVSWADRLHGMVQGDWDALLAFADKYLMGKSVSRRFDEFPKEAYPESAGRVRIILVGDSTVALKNGWGPGFCALVTPQVACEDLGKNGRSSSSYRAEGSWGAVMKELKAGGDFRATYVLIQFGHNDQPGKPGRSTDLATEYPVNLRGYVDEVKAAGGKAVLVTPLTRRSFQDGKLRNDLVPWADAARRVAQEAGIPVLELNADSSAAVQKMGPVEANTLAMAPAPAVVEAGARQGNSPAAPKPVNAVEPNGDPVPVFDYTHLGEKGAAFFGRMVADELTRAVPELSAYFRGSK